VVEIGAVGTLWGAQNETGNIVYEPDGEVGTISRDKE